MRLLVSITCLLLTFASTSTVFAAEPDPRLIRAAAQADVSEVRAALDAGGDIDAALDPDDPMPITPLSAAVASGSRETVRLLLDHGADPRGHDAVAMTLALMLQDSGVVAELLPLLGRIRPEDPPFVNILTTRPSLAGATLLARLIKAEAVGEPLSDERSVEDLLHIFLSGRFSENSHDPALRILQMLTEAGAPVDRTTSGIFSDNLTALQGAAAAGDLLMIDALVAAGATYPDGWSRTDLDQAALAGAARSGNGPGIATVIGRGADPNRPDRDGRYALPWAGAFKRLDLVEVLLAHGANPDLYGIEQNSTLHDAASADRSDIVQAMLRAGANPGLIDPERAWPLRAAVREGATETVRLLVTAGANINAVDAMGRTALHELNTSEGRYRELSPLHYETVRVMGSRGFDFSLLDREHRSPIGSLVRHAARDLEVLNAFADAGSAVLPDLMSSAIEHERPDVLKWGLAHGASAGAPADLLERAFLRFNRVATYESVTALLRAGGPLPESQERKAQMLQAAAEHGAGTVVVALVQRGVEPDGRTATASAVSRALENGHAAIVGFLLEKGASPRSPNPGGATVAHDLVGRDADATRAGWQPVIRDEQKRALAALIERGLDLAARDASGRTIEEIAAAVPGTLQRWREAIALAAKNETEFHRAVRRNDLPALSRLISGNAGLNAPDGLGRSALTLALQLRRTGAAERLLAAGAAYTIVSPNAYQVPDLDFAADDRLAPAFLLRMLTERVLDLSAHDAASRPETSLGRFSANQKLQLADAVWTVNCSPCTGPVTHKGNQRTLYIKSYRQDTPQGARYGLVQSNFGPVTLRLRDLIPNSRGETAIELVYTVGGALSIPACSFDFADDPTCYPGVTITNPNHASEFTINTGSGPNAYPGAMMSVTQNSRRWEIEPGKTMTFDRSRGALEILLLPVTSKIFAFSFTVAFGDGPTLPIDGRFEDGARAATYARILSMRTQAASIPGTRTPESELEAKTLATAVHIASAMAVKEKYPQFVRERLRARAEDIRQLNAQVIALRNAVLANSTMTPEQIALLIVRIDRLLADPAVTQKPVLEQIRAGLDAALRSARETGAAIELLRENLYSDVDRMVRDYQALILEYAQYVPMATLYSIIGTDARSVIRQRINPADVVITDAMINRQGAALRNAFGLPAPAGERP